MYYYEPDGSLPATESSESDHQSSSIIRLDGQLRSSTGSSEEDISPDKAWKHPTFIREITTRREQWYNDPKIPSDLVEGLQDAPTAERFSAMRKAIPWNARTEPNPPIGANKMELRPQQTGGSSEQPRAGTKAFQRLEDDATRFEEESDLKFENDMRRLCWSSGLSRAVVEQVIASHRQKQDLKRTMRRYGVEEALARNKHKEEPTTLTGKNDDDTDSEHSATTIRQGRQDFRTSMDAVNQQFTTKVVSHVAPRINTAYKHRIDIPPEIHSVVVAAGPSGRVEFLAADGLLRHVEEWLPNEELANALPRVPTPPPRASSSSQAIEHQLKDQRTHQTIKGELIVGLLEDLQRSVQQLKVGPAIAPPLQASQANVQTVKAGEEKDDGAVKEEPEDLTSNRQNVQSIKQLAAPHQKKRKPRPWKGKQRAVDEPQSEMVTAG